MVLVEIETNTKRRQYADASGIFLEEIKELPAEYFYLFVFHLSNNNLSYLRAWVQGVPYNSVISIPYSEQRNVKSEIEKLTPVYSPALEEIPEIIIKICRENSDKKVVLVQIGGYSSSIVDKIPNVVLAVEDTERGHRVFVENEQNLTYPVVSIARTKGKKMEDEIVGHAITKSVQLTLSSLRKNVLSGRMLVLGYGGIGRATALSLMVKGYIVSAYDPKPELMEVARKDGCVITKRSEAIGNADVIIGCSGYESIQTNDIPLLRFDALLISGSSRQVEFPYGYLSSRKDQMFKHDLIEKFDIAERSIYIAYKAQPINFYFDIGLGDIFDIPMTLLVHSVIWGLKNNLANKLYELPQGECRQVLSRLAKLGLLARS